MTDEEEVKIKNPLATKGPGRCPHCGKPPYPVWDKENKKIIWINLFKTDLFHVIFLILILFGAWAYTNDIEQYEMIKDDPGGFCNQWCIKNKEIQFYNETNQSYIVGGFVKKDGKYEFAPEDVLQNISDT